MLCLLTPPFESDEHFYELKWDGFRSLCFIDADRSVRLVGRRRTIFTGRFPELSALRRLPRGTLLDGEIVDLATGRPDFAALLRRERSYHGASPSLRAERAARDRPVTFVAFDVLYEKFKSTMAQPLSHRREILERVVRPNTDDRLLLSEGRLGGGLAFFSEITKSKLEGIVAKRWDAPYEPGQRSGVWSKFKQRHEVVAVIVGYGRTGTGGVKSLHLATDVDGTIRYIGKVGSGISNELGRAILKRLSSLTRPEPVVPASAPDAIWVEPAVFCKVSFAEWTNDSRLRQPVFEALIG